MNISFRFSRSFVFVLCLISLPVVWCSQSTPLEANSTKETQKIEVVYPLKNQVFQRRFEVPQLAHSNHPGGPARGFAEVPLRLQWTKNDQQVVEYRLREGTKTTEWKTLSDSRVSEFPELPGITQIVIDVPAGGWYRVDFQMTVDGQLNAQATSEPFGVGEVFLIAGQSYATNCNDERLQVADRTGRVVAYDSRNGTWNIAHDPQPAGDSSDGGSIWPPFGDLLVHTYGVPVGLANVAVGGTSTSQWKTDGELFQRLETVGRQLKDFRAVLWQQGESDVIEKTPSTAYIERLVQFRAQADQTWGTAIPWFLAKSTLHPTVYHEPFWEANIRNAVETLIEKHGFKRGPDTDRLDGPNRGPIESRRHFTGQGQQNAAAMWFAALTLQLDAPKPSYLQHVQDLAELHLRQPAWKSPVVYNESSVLLQDAQGAVSARLAFPAEEILNVRSAMGFMEWKQGEHWRLDAGRTAIEWIGEPPIDAIPMDQLYPPAGAPNSYKHRKGNPEQNLLYMPGKWFHERNIELTYRRQNFDQFASLNLPKQLEKSLDKLHRKSRLVLAVSGDSISTGLDASATTLTIPNQSGYPELVAAQLTRDFGAPIELVNRSVAGWSIANGIDDLEKLLESKPDLLIVAYGMNDVGRRDPDWFAKQARLFQERAKERLPELEILWVAPMLGNREWVHTPREMFFAYRDALQGIVKDGESLVDMTEIWRQLLDHKHDLDLTGNGLNHPNDFGHRLYAQAILEHLSHSFKDDKAVHFDRTLTR